MTDIRIKIERFIYSIPTKVSYCYPIAIYRVKFVLRLTQLTSVLTRLNICQRGKSLRLGSNLYTACCKRKNTGRCFTITEAICTPFKRFFERFVVSVISIRDFLNGIWEDVCNFLAFRNVNTNVWFVWSMFNSWFEILIVLLDIPSSFHDGSRIWKKMRESKFLINFVKYIRIYRFSHLVWPLRRSLWLFLFVIIYVGNSIIKNSNISSSCIMKSKCNFFNMI